jgi:hypothetical protein
MTHKNKSQKAIYQPSFSASIVPHGLYPVQLRLLTELRKAKNKQEEILAINYLIVSASTAFIESIISELLIGLCEKSLEGSSKSEIVSNLTASKLEEIYKSSFRQSTEILKAITGKGLDELVEKDCWQAICNLFSLRNQLAHGKRITITTSYNTEDINDHELSSKNLSGLMSYLIKQKVITETELSGRPHLLLGNKVVRYFAQNTVFFVESLATNLSRTYNLDKSLSFTDRIGTLKTLLLEL